MLFLHPIALGIIGILRPSGIFCCPRAYGPWAAENALGAENTNDPSGKGCKNLPFPNTVNITVFVLPYLFRFMKAPINNKMAKFGAT